MANTQDSSSYTSPTVKPTAEQVNKQREKEVIIKKIKQSQTDLSKILFNK